MGTEPVGEFQEAVVAELQQTKLTNAKDQLVGIESECASKGKMLV
jgi:hypothetical protein